MVPRAQLELQDREALWVFLVREESEGCQACQDQRCVSGTLSSTDRWTKDRPYLPFVGNRCEFSPFFRVHQENRDLQDKQERRDHQVQLAFPGPTVLVGILVLMYV